MLYYLWQYNRAISFIILPKYQAVSCVKLITKEIKKLLTSLIDLMALMPRIYYFEQ